MTTRDSILKLYEQEADFGTGGAERLFRVAAICSCLFFGAFGAYLATHNPPPEMIMQEKTMRLRQVSFIVEEKKKAPAPAAEPKKTEAPKPLVKEEPVDLTSKPLLDQKAEDTKPENENATTDDPVRRVYGLRRVYSTGLGAGGEMGDAVIGKQGNTLNAEIDTITATKEDLAGRVVPITTVTTAPRLLKDVKPAYTKEMIDAEVEGVVRAQLLIDASGKVKEVKILNDLGFGTREMAIEAFLQWQFAPAKRGTDPVAVWITYAVRFVLLEN